MRNKDYLTYESVAANLPKTYLDWDSDSTESSEYNITLQHTEETLNYGITFYIRL